MVPVRIPYGIEDDVYEGIRRVHAFDASSALEESSNSFSFSFRVPPFRLLDFLLPSAIPPPLLSAAATFGGGTYVTLSPFKSAHGRDGSNFPTNETSLAGLGTRIGSGSVSSAARDMGREGVGDLVYEVTVAFFVFELSERTL